MLNRTLPQPPPVISVHQPAMSPVSLSTSVVIWAQDNFRQRTMASVSRQAAWTMMSDVTQTHAWSVRSQSTLGWNQSCKRLPAGSPKKDRRGANLRLAHGNPAVLRTRQGALTHCHQTTPSCSCFAKNRCSVSMKPAPWLLSKQYQATGGKNKGREKRYPSNFYSIAKTTVVAVAEDISLDSSVIKSDFTVWTPSDTLKSPLTTVQKLHSCTSSLFLAEKRYCH